MVSFLSTLAFLLCVVIISHSGQWLQPGLFADLWPWSCIGPVALHWTCRAVFGLSRIGPTKILTNSSTLIAIDRELRYHAFFTPRCQENIPYQCTPKSYTSPLINIAITITLTLTLTLTNSDGTRPYSIST